jgi:3-hydroxyisobutyrate dehydrogenase-like beta-hydroxyacid dehydrogenase
MTATTVTVFGLGPMGRALVDALLDAGHRVTVWNRTAGKAADALTRGAVWAEGPAAAVAASDLTLVNVVDHSVTDALLDTAGDAVAGRTIVGLSSDTPGAARATDGLVTKLGGHYLDGAIMTPTETIGSRAASVLFAGPRPLFDAHRQVFESLGTPTWVGAEIGRAAAHDMALLDFFWTSVSGALHAMSMARANGITPAELRPHAQGIVAILPAIVDELAERLQADRHADSSAPVSSVAASLPHLIAASRDAGVDTAALEAFRRYADAAVAAGRGDDEVTRTVEFMRT